MGVSNLQTSFLDAFTFYRGWNQTATRQYTIMNEVRCIENRKAFCTFEIFETEERVNPFVGTV